MNVYMYVNKDLKAPRNDSEHIVNMQLFAKKIEKIILQK